MQEIPVKEYKWNGIKLKRIFRGTFFCCLKKGTGLVALSKGGIIQQIVDESIDPHTSYTFCGLFQNIFVFAIFSWSDSMICVWCTYVQRYRGRWKRHIVFVDRRYNYGPERLDICGIKTPFHGKTVLKTMRAHIFTVIFRVISILNSADPQLNKILIRWPLKYKYNTVMCLLCFFL